MKDILAMHSHAHPSLQPQDAIKLCYQAAFGAEHLLINEEKARNYFDAEWESVSSADIPLWEMISEGYGRVNLAAWKHMYLPREWLFRMFVLTASEEAKNGMQTIHSFIPLSEMFGYATDLRSKTQGRGTYSMEPSHYDEVPKSILDTIVASRAKKED